MTSKRPHSYSLEFRNKIVEFARAGHNVDGLVFEFKLARQTVRNWVKRDDLDAGRRNDGVTSDERTELMKLRKEISSFVSSEKYCQKLRPGLLRRQT